MHKPHVQLSKGATVCGTRVRAERGYTLTELLAGTFIGLAALATFFGFNRFQLFALRTQSAQIELQTMGRSLTDLFTREVRRAGMDPTCVKTFEGIAEARWDQIRVKSDLNGNGVIDASGEDVTYSYQYWPQAVLRTAGSAAEQLTDSNTYVWGWLEYFDGAGNQIAPWSTLTQTQRALVRRVRLTLWMWAQDADPQTYSWLEASFSSNVDLRNRFFVVSTACP